MEKEPLIPKRDIVNEYEGSISDVSSDGTVDYRGRPADKATFGRWKAVSFILGAVILERLAYYGIASNLISYLTIKLHQGSAEAVTNVWIWGGVAWLTPLLGGFIADSFLGRYWTITFSLLIYIVGMVLLTVSVSVPGLKPPECSTEDGSCEPASQFQVRMFYMALYTVAVGVGGIKPCFSSLGADQFEEEDRVERAMKRSYFNYWWVAVTIGSFLALTVLVYLEDRVSYGWGYGIPTAGLAVATALFLLGTRHYRYKPLPRNSPLTQVARVLVAALTAHSHLHDPEPASLLLPHQGTLPHYPNLRFLDKAAIPTGASKEEVDASTSKWRVCTVTEVEEVKLLIRVLPVWLTTLTFMVTCQQTSTFFLRQGLTLDPTILGGFRIPPASLELACVVTSLVLIPLYDRHLVPYLRRCTGDERGLSLLQRMGVGLVVTVAAMTVAAVVEARRLQVVRNQGLEYSEVALPMSVAWLLPQYCIIGVAQVFAYMGQLEFFYDQVPDNMQTIGTSLFTSNTGVAHFVSAWILWLITHATGRWSGQPWIVSNLNQSRLDKYYWMLAVLSALNCVAFFWVSLGYTYKPSTRQGPDHKVIPDDPLLLD